MNVEIASRQVAHLRLAGSDIATSAFSKIHQMPIYNLHATQVT